MLAFCEVVSPESSFAICSGIAGDLRVFCIVACWIGRLCYKPMINVSKVSCMKLSRVILPFVSLCGVISLMKMFMFSIANESFAIIQLTVLQDV